MGRFAQFQADIDILSTQSIAKISKEQILENTDLSTDKAEMISRFLRPYKVKKYQDNTKQSSMVFTIFRYYYNSKQLFRIQNTNIGKKLKTFYSSPPGSFRGWKKLCLNSINELHCFRIFIS
jgi:hypothetical protein